MTVSRPLPNGRVSAIAATHAKTNINDKIFLFILYVFITLYYTPKTVSRLSQHRHTVHRNSDTPFIDVPMNGVSFRGSKIS